MQCKPITAKSPIYYFPFENTGIYPEKAKLRYDLSMIIETEILLADLEPRPGNLEINLINSSISGILFDIS